MGTSAQTAQGISDSLKVPYGELPKFARVSEALVRLRALPIDDDVDELVVRDVIGRLGQLRNAAEHAERPKPT